MIDESDNAPEPRWGESKEPTPTPMTVDRYRDLALRTEADQAKILSRLVELGPQAMRLDNAARGLAGDAGEVSTAVMKFIEYGKPLDAVNMLEEVGDVLWRLNQVCAAMEALTGKPFTITLAMEANIAKLKARYGEKYSDLKALNRDKEAEQRAVYDTARESHCLNAFQKALTPEERERYQSLEKEHLGDYEKKTGIYGPKSVDPKEWATAVLRAQWLMTARSDRVPQLARDFLGFVISKMGTSSEVCLYAFAVYAELVEKLPRGVDGYEPRPEDKAWLEEEMKKQGVKPPTETDGGKDADSAKLNPTTTRA